MAMKSRSFDSKFELKLSADYYQFYLQDEAVDGDLSDSWNEEAVDRLLAATNGTIGVGTVRNTEVPVLLEISNEEPNDDFKYWDKVNECSIAIPSGKLVIAGCMDYFPEAKRINIPKGTYRARIYYGGLDKINDDGLDGEDNYRIVLWLDFSYRDVVRIKG